jgi:hypothetical protein
MNKTLLVIGVASIAAATFIFACTAYPPLSALFTSGKTFVLGLAGQIGSFATTNPLTAPIIGAITTAVTYITMSVRASTKQNEMASSASQERTDIINQSQGIFTEQSNQITSLKTQVDALTAKVQETASLKTEIVTLKTSLSAAQQEAQRVRDEYNALIRIRAVAESLPVAETTVH